MAGLSRAGSGFLLPARPNPAFLVPLCALCLFVVGLFNDFPGVVLRKRGQRMTSMPPMYGRSASGTTTEPSACW